MVLVDCPLANKADVTSRIQVKKYLIFIADSKMQATKKPVVFGGWLFCIICPVLK
jgi:hypothetical protein